MRTKKRFYLSFTEDVDTEKLSYNDLVFWSQKNIYRKIDSLYIIWCKRLNIGINNGTIQRNTKM